MTDEKIMRTINGMEHSICPLANLREANLSRADLRWMDLREANLSRANLSGADLRGADLSGANLSRANLSGADLRGVDLRRVDLDGILIVISGLKWPIYLLAGSAQIGCEIHTIAEWKAFDESEIKDMDARALAFWKEYKNMLIKLHESNNWAVI